MLLPRLVRIGPKSLSPSSEASARQRLPRRKAAKKALVKRENQGNLAPVENGGRFFCADTSHHQPNQIVPHSAQLYRDEWDLNTTHLTANSAPHSKQLYRACKSGVGWTVSAPQTFLLCLGTL